MPVVVVDYGMSNLGSIRRALEECGAEVLVSEDPKDLRRASRIVLPGVGAFGDGMRNLESRGWVPEIRTAVLQDGIPLLGICLGMQLLGDSGYEGGVTRGMGLVPGTVRRLEPDLPGVKIPHVGWNEVYPSRPSPLFDGIPDGSDFYFVHSYHFLPADAGGALATTPYCGSFVSAVAGGNVSGVQFHPEKSGHAGFLLLKNFLKS